MNKGPRPLEIRFWEKVDRREPDECWLWLAVTNNHGYGMLQKKDERGRNGKRLAHRISYEINVGPIPDGLSALHRCDNPRCVNPAHLFLGTKKDNTRDMYGKGRARPGKVPREKQWAVRYPERIKRGAEHPQAMDPSLVLRGERNGNAKLTADLVRQYRSELSAGKALRQLARETGLDRKTLMAMRDRKTWAHVPD